MTPRQALPILRALADGIDPHTGEVFPAGCAYQQADAHKGDRPNAIRLTSTMFIGIIRGALPF